MNEDNQKLEQLPDEVLQIPGMESHDSESKDKLVKYSMMVNIADDLDDDLLTEISGKVTTGFDEDKRTCEQWFKSVEEAQKLAKLVKEEKNTPLPQSANIKFPLITNACYQFAARTYPELVKDGKVVKAAIIGKDPSGTKQMIGDRVATHMSYQLLFQSSEWEASMDKLLVVLPNVGFLCKKTYFDPLRKVNVSDVCDYKDIIINSDVKSLESARRISHVIYMHANDMVEYARSGLFLEDVVDDIIKQNSGDKLDKPFELVEQHRFLDLDDDGYEEPYIVTQEMETHKIVRIVPRYTQDDIEFDEKDKVIRVNPVLYFTAFHFLPSPDGKFQSIGFGTLMLHLNETVNTILNQLIDSGSLNNMQGGFIDARIKIQGGQTLHDPGEWKRVKGLTGVNMKDGIFPHAYKEPSQTLFQLLGLLIQTSKDLSSSTEVLSGTQPAQNVPATTIMALVEQGMKVFNAIQRRMYRSLKDEYTKLFRLNSIYLDPQEYIGVIGQDLAVSRTDYQMKNLAIMPVADPNLSSDAQRFAQIQALMQLAGKPGINTFEIYKRYLQALNVSNLDAILPPNQPPPPPSPDEIKVKGDLQIRQGELQLKQQQQALDEREALVNLGKKEAEIDNLHAQAVNQLAQAQTMGKDAEIRDYELQLQILRGKIDDTFKSRKMLIDHSQNMINTVHKGVELGQNQQQLDQNQQQLDQQGNQNAQASS